ncbi:alpha-1-antiproteinase-like [Apodemus sylvaticus]|uniref:alpha-1-antiproteinase-like n=1 Tax=Apodemus sylvaticus TaxID=10129 RepID=UPI0022441576|nr:alpha-1-antiproteinase-like [Apodemus sylvaticus]
MAFTILFLWLFLPGLVPCSCDPETPPTETSNVSRIPAIQGVRSFFNNQNFALSLYKQLPQPKTGRNIIFSPLSIIVPLVLLAFQQPKPEARHQVLQDLGFRVTGALDTKAAMQYGELLSTLLHADHCGVQTGSLLFIDKTLKPKKTFLTLANSSYNSDVILISFGNHELAKKQIDLAIRAKTHGKVTRLLRNLKPPTNLFLANYNFFKGKWKHSFNPKYTGMRYFSLGHGTNTLVPMMQRIGWFQLQYFSQMHSYVLQLPFTCRISGVFFLPNDGKLKECEKALLEQSFDTWIQPLPLKKRWLFFPKFSIPVALQLERFRHVNSNLKLFNEHMDLSGITLQKAPLRVTTAVHRVELTVDEDGEEEDVSNINFYPEPSLATLHFNRSFLLLILDEASNSLLFMGRVVNPTRVNISDIVHSP